jgi:uncharacterized membrane-anchored protein YhcB (DUF1043 family)
MVIGLICGCVAAEVARVRENALERQKRLEAEVEALRAAEAVRANAKTQPLPSAPPPP